MTAFAYPHHLARIAKHRTCFQMSSSFEHKRLRDIQLKIENYIKQDTPIQSGIKSRAPIPKVPFDTIFLNIFSIKTIYTTPSEDRIIISLNNDNKYIYYSTCDDDKKKIRKIIEIVPNSITVIVISDVRNVFDNENSFLYSEKL